MAYEDYHVNADDVKLDGDPNIRRTVPPSPSGGGGGIAYGTCTTAANVAEKVVTLSDASGWELKQGATICIKFTNTNTAQNPTLNVNNSGAKSIYYNRALITTGSLWVAGENDRYTTFMYDGTYWVWIGSSIDRNTTYTLSDRSMDVYCETVAATAAKVGTAFWYTLKNNSKFHIRFRYANSAQSKLTLNVDGKGAKDLWINGVISSSTNYTLPAGEYECVYYNNAYYLRTDSPYAFIPSHIGQIVESTMLASEDDCKKLYGFNTSWIQHSGYMLRGATSGVTANHTGNDGGVDEITPTGSFSGTNASLAHSGGGVSGHTLTLDQTPSGLSRFWYNNSGAWATGIWAYQGNNAYCTTLSNQTGYGTYGKSHSHGHTNPNAHSYTPAGSITINKHSTLPKYKNVYIWERTA